MFRRLDPKFLHGKWSYSGDDFLWRGVKIIQKTASDNPYDKWVAYATGMCLTTSVQCLAARFDPTSGLLHFTPSARKTKDGPWKLLISFEANLEAPSPDDAVFFTMSGLANLQSKRSDLYRNAWDNREANLELMKLATDKWSDPFGTFGILPREGGPSAAVQEDVSHGAVWGFRELYRIEEAELRDRETLESVAAGRRIA